MEENSKYIPVRKYNNVIILEMFGSRKFIVEFYSGSAQGVNFSCIIIFLLFLTDLLQGRIQDFPEGGAPTPEGVPKYYLTNFSRKLHENEEILARNGEHVHALSDLPLHNVGYV